MFSPNTRGMHFKVKDRHLDHGSFRGKAKKALREEVDAALFEMTGFGDWYQDEPTVLGHFEFDFRHELWYEDWLEKMYPPIDFDDWELDDIDRVRLEEENDSNPYGDDYYPYDWDY